MEKKTTIILLLVTIPIETGRNISYDIEDNFFLLAIKNK